LEGVPDDAEVFFSVDIDQWPEDGVVEWGDGTRVMSIGWDGNIFDSHRQDDNPENVCGVHFLIIGEFNVY
jgi:hypothetical protein